MAEKKNSRIGPIEKATSRSWEDWLKFMESVDAPKLNHHEIATKVYYELEGKIDNPGWWAQSVSVAYEQEIGRRIPGQRPDGTFQTSVSKSTGRTMMELMQTWVAFAAGDAAVQEQVAQTPKVAGTENRHTWRTKAKDGSALTVIAEPKANGTASLVVQVVGTETLEQNEEAKERWTEIVTRFLADLGSSDETAVATAAEAFKNKKSGMM